MTEIAPYGSWRSPISADLLVSKTVRLAEPCLDGEYLYWLESRPWEKGRTVIVRQHLQQLQEQPQEQPQKQPQAPPQTRKSAQDILPLPLNARSRVHEYGGGSYCVADGIVYFVLYDDQRLYRLDTNLNTAFARSTPEPLTPPGERRYADLSLDKPRNRLLCVCEDHSEHGEPRNSIVAISLDKLDAGALDPGTPAPSSTLPQTLVQGEDFYSNARVSPDGTRLSWLSWQHPDMPWDNTRCWVAELDTQGRPQRPKCIAGGNNESVFQPQWSPGGELFFVSDRTNWWNIYRWADSGGAGEQGSDIDAVTNLEAEFATPQWVFGMSTYGFISDDTLIACYTQAGTWNLVRIDTTTNTLTPIETELTHIAGLCCRDTHGGVATWLGASPTRADAVWYYNPSLPTGQQLTEVKTTGVQLDPKLVSHPRAIRFPSADQRVSHGFFYPPTNPDFAAADTDRPPLIVLCHGGPTGATESSLNPKTQYWTSRGFAVLDVNYSGSTGYGRHYREQLLGNWGVADVEDVCAGAKFLVDEGLVDGARLAIKGGSAGGYTVLAALTFKQTFKAGASHYGIGDLETLARDTHKFESRYLDKLIGPYPRQRQRYWERSPIHHCDQLNCPVIFFQGLEDKVVPPAQAEAMVNALRGKRIPVAYVPFAGEGHGFRQGESIKRALEGELYFYAKIFGISPTDSIEPLTIDHLRS